MCGHGRWRSDRWRCRHRRCGCRRAAGSADGRQFGARFRSPSEYGCCYDDGKQDGAGAGHAAPSRGFLPRRVGKCPYVDRRWGGRRLGKLREVVADERFGIEVDFFCVSTNEAAAEGGRWERGAVISLDGGQRARRHSSALRHCSDRETLGLSCCSELCADVHARSPWLRSGR